MFAYDFNFGIEFEVKIEEKEKLSMPLEIEEEEEDVGKADGLKKFCEFLPFTNTPLEEFMSYLQEILTDEEYEGLTLDSIKDKFQSFPEW